MACAGATDDHVPTSVADNLPERDLLTEQQSRKIRRSGIWPGKVGHSISTATKMKVRTSKEKTLSFLGRQAPLWVHPEFFKNRVNIHRMPQLCSHAVVHFQRA